MQSQESHNKRNDTITPVVIGLIQPLLDNNSPQIVLDEQICEQLSLAGLFSLTQKGSTKWVFDFNDGTGDIKITFSKKYNEDFPMLLKNFDLTKKFYGKVLVIYTPIFNAEIQKNEPFFAAFNLQKMIDYNYISFHALETLLAKKCRKTGIFSKFEDKFIYDPSKKKNEKENDSNTKKDEDNKENNVNEELYEELDRIIINSIKSIKLNTGDGVTFEGLKKFFKGKVDNDKLEESLEELKENGSIYVVPGTIDKYECF